MTRIPSRVSTPATKSAAFRVSPGGFDVSMRTYSWSSRVVSSCVCAARDAAATRTDARRTRRTRRDLVFLRAPRVPRATSVRALRGPIARRRQIQRVEQHREGRVRLRAVLRPQHFIDHRVEVVRRRTDYELRKAREREHLLLGFQKALQHLDEVIRLIR